MSSSFLNKSTPSISSKSSFKRSERPGVFDEIIKLKLKKPKSWNWELTTSKSSPNIAFPRIMLYDEKGELLADAKESDFVFQGPAEKLKDGDYIKRTASVSQRPKRHHSSSSIKSNKDKSASSGPPSKRLNDCLDSFVGQLQTQGIDCKLRRYLSQNDVIERKKPKRYDSNNEVRHRNSMISLGYTAYEPNTNESNEIYFSGNDNKKYNSTNKLGKFVDNEPAKSDQVLEKCNLRSEEKDSGLPQHRHDMHSNESLNKKSIKYKKSRTMDLAENVKGCKDFKGDSPSPIERKQFHIEKGNSFKEVRFDLKKSQSAMDISKREKRKCRRSNTSVPRKFSGSILERMSAFKKRSSSEESEDEHKQEGENGELNKPKYFLRSCRAGTLFVCEESFRHRKVRRRPQSYPRISENDENDNNIPIRSEKVIQKYIYPGSTNSVNAIDEIINNNDGQSLPASDSSKMSWNRYDEEIDKINKLIEKVSLPKQHRQAKEAEMKKPEISSQGSSYGSTINSKSTNTSSSGLQSTPRQKGQLIMEVKQTTTENGIGIPQRTEGTLMPTKNPRSDVSPADQSGSPLSPRNYREQNSSLNSSNKLSFNQSSDKSHSPAAIGDAKTKRKKKTKELSRNVKESRLLVNHSSSSSSDEGTGLPNTSPCVRTSRRGRDYRRKVSPRNDNNNNRLHKRLVRYLLEKFAPLNGDQILALKSNLSAVKAIGTSADFIDEPSDEVLLHLVRHLASLKQQQKSSTDKEYQKNLQNLQDSKTFNNNHRLPTVPYDIKALEQSINEFLNLTNSDDDLDGDLDEERNIAIERPDILPSLSDEDISLRTETETESESDLASVITTKRKSSVCNENQNDDHEIIADITFNNKSSKTNKPKHNVNELEKNSRSTQEISDKINNNIISNNYTGTNRCNIGITPITSDDIQKPLPDTTTNGDIDSTTATETTSEEDDNNLVTNNMGSNVSRNSGKGLSGRRTQSSGNLYSGKHQNGPNRTPARKHINKQNAMTSGNDGGRENLTNGDTTDGGGGTGNLQTFDSNHQSEICPTKLMMGQLSAVTQKDRNKFCGSLPNHLDSDDVVENEGIQSNQLEYVTVAPRRQPYPPSQQLQFQQQQQYSPYNNSASEKETASTSSGSSTFKINQEKPDIQLKLPLTRSNFDPSCDQGYGSERSPEDEIPPPMPNMLPSPYQHLMNPVDWDYEKYTAAFTYNFITKDCTFCVPITKGPRGLGLSISGGIDSNAAFPGLIRVKRLFPHQAAWSTGKLQPGDIILEVNGVTLTGLTNYEALEVLRTMPNDVVLLVCRPTDEQYRKLSPPTEPPKPPQRTQQQSTQATQTLPDETYPLQPLAPLQTNFNGEFEIIMVKQQGSLGFTLRKEDESVLGHYVRALVREPATTDGRIKPGDKIVAVNDVPLSPLTHEEAVIFLRQAADTVKLRLYRDEAQTPVAAMSPNSSENKTICGSGKKPYLRPEAINLLSDLAYKKQIPAGDSTESSIKSNTTSPRRLRRGNKQQSNSGNTSTSEVETTDSKSSSNQQYLVSSQTTSVCSDSEQSMASQCSYIVQAPETSENELFKMPDDEDKPDRPNFLDLAGQSGSTPVVSRKPRFQFTVASNAYELNNLDNDALDAPIYTGNENGVESGDTKLPDNHEFTSLPCETFLIACKTESDLKNEASFSHKNPLYQSAHVQVPLSDEAAADLIKKEGNKSLLKWKGVMFSPAIEEKNTSETTDSSCGATIGTNPTPRTESDFDVKEFASNMVEGHKMVSVELNRGWNSRLGFSLQPDPNTKKTIISAIYGDSVAAKDGRLRVGDQLMTVNDESVENMSTSNIIDLLRIIRGSICITVIRKDANNQT